MGAGSEISKPDQSKKASATLYDFTVLAQLQLLRQKPTGVVIDRMIAGTNENNGWMSWAKNSEKTGTSSLDKAIRNI